MYGVGLYRKYIVICKLKTVRMEVILISHAQELKYEFMYTNNNKICI